MSIATQTGDDGTTALIGGVRVSKADLRVEAYGTVDELNAVLGVARSQCSDPDIRARTEAIQRTLFRVGAVMSRPSTTPLSPSAAASRAATDLSAAEIEELTAQIHAVETIEGILADWSLPGAHPESALFEVARTVCRRAERCAVRLRETETTLPSEPIVFLNRLSDLLWLFGRLLEHRSGVDSRLRDPSAAEDSGTVRAGNKAWSRAW